MATPDAVKLWIDTVFRDQVHEICAKPDTLALLKIGYETGDSPEAILTTVVSSVVLEAAGMDPNDYAKQC